MAHPIPDIEFQHLLAHTFPGLLLTIAIFMMLDIFSGWDLTGALRDFQIFLGFIGSMLLCGTILGVILDAIHHSIIEEIIFENFKGAKDLECKLKRITPWKNIDKELFWKHHYFLPFMGLKPIDTLNYITNYYRYSEFYTNIFISLIAFSFVAPFYLFSVMQLTWRLSVITGIVTLIIACLCFNEGYMAYKRFLRALLSFLCGIEDKDKLLKGKKIENPPHDISNVKVDPKNITKKELIFNLLIYFLFLIFLIYTISTIPYISHLSKESIIIFGSIGVIITFIINFFISIWILKGDIKGKNGIIKSTSSQSILLNNSLTEKRDHICSQLHLFKNFLERDAFEITSSLLISIFILLLILLSSNPPQISIYPTELNIEKNSTDNLSISYLKTISIKNIESNLIKMVIEPRGINFTRLYAKNNRLENTNNITITNIQSGKTEFIMVNINYPENMVVGEYLGEIAVHAETNDGEINKIIPISIQCKS